MSAPDPHVSSVPEPSPAKSSARTRILLLVALVAAVTFAVFHFRNRISFDWTSLGAQLRAVSWQPILLGIVLIYICYWLRALRWAILIRPLRRVSPNALVPSQVIGFTAVAFIGRVADFARPYLVARRFNLPVAGQLAIYTVERAFDLAAAAFVFSATLEFAPASLPHHHAYVRAGEISLAATLGIVLFAVALRLAGGTVASILRTLINPLSKDFAQTVAARILDFRDGLGTVSSARQFGLSALVSLVMWYAVAACYLLSARAFTAEPTLAKLSFTAVMVIFASSLGASLLQLPIIGWFTQIAVLAGAFHTLLNVPIEAATACAAVTLVITTLAILPAGLIAARFQGTSLRNAARAGDTASAG